MRRIIRIILRHRIILELRKPLRRYQMSGVINASAVFVEDPITSYRGTVVIADDVVQADGEQIFDRRQTTGTGPHHAHAAIPSSVLRPIGRQIWSTAIALYDQPPEKNAAKPAIPAQPAKQLGRLTGLDGGWLEANLQKIRLAATLRRRMSSQWQRPLPVTESRPAAAKAYLPAPATCRRPDIPQHLPVEAHRVRQSDMALARIRLHVDVLEGSMKIAGAPDGLPHSTGDVEIL